LQNPSLYIPALATSKPPGLCSNPPELPREPGLGREPQNLKSPTRLRRRNTSIAVSTGL
jgi:hypothetical protein